MSVKLPLLYEEGRMTFPAEKKTVREGDVFAAEATAGRPTLGLRPRDVPFVGHTGVIVVERRGVDDRARRIVDLNGVTGAWTLQVRGRDQACTSTSSSSRTIRRGPRLPSADAVPHAADVILDAPFLLIDPLRYPWADEIRESALPKTIG